MGSGDHGTRYELLERIGAGGMAEVFKARVVGAAGFAKVVAIKRILPSYSSDPDFVTRFIDEARLTARLQHPNICQVLDFGTMEGRYFIAMEYVDGLDLAKALNVLDRWEASLPPDVCLAVAAGVLRGLGHAHRAADDDGEPLGLVHRDVSPHNVLLSVNGDVKLSDFGAAKAAASLRQAHTMDNIALGKLLYMAPEQRRGLPVDERTDLHGVGILMAEMILGAATFRRAATELGIDDGLLVRPIADRFPEPLAGRVAALIARATQQRASGRHADAASMLADVEDCARELGSRTPGDRIASLVRRLRGDPPRTGSTRQPAEPPSRSRAPEAATAALPSSRGSASASRSSDLLGSAPGPTGAAVASAPTQRPSTRTAALPPRAGTGSTELSVEDLLYVEDLPTNVLGGPEEMTIEPQTVARLSADDGVEDLATRVLRGGEAASSGTHDVDTLETMVRQDDPETLEHPTYVMPGAFETEAATTFRRGGLEPGQAEEDGGATLLRPPIEAAAPTGEDLETQIHHGALPRPSPPPAAVAAPRPQASPAPPRAPAAPWLVAPAEPERRDPREPGHGAAGRPRAAAQTSAQGDSTALVRLPKRRAVQVRLLILGLLVATLGVGALAWGLSRWGETSEEPFEVPLGQGGLVLPGEGDLPPSLEAPPFEPPPSASDLPPTGVSGPPPRPRPATDPDEPRGREPGESPTPRAEEAPPRDPAPRERPPHDPASREERSPSDPASREERPPSGPAGRGQSTLSILSTPPGRAYVDGRLVSARTPVSGVQVTPGTHTVRVVFGSTREAVERRVTVRQGQTEVVRLTPSR